MRTMRIVERDEIGQSAHCCVRERGEVIRDLRPEFIQQRGEFVTVIGEHVTRVDVHDPGTEALHYAQRVICKCDG